MGKGNNVPYDVSCYGYTPLDDTVKQPEHNFEDFNTRFGVK